MSLGLSSALTLSLSSYVPAIAPVSYDFVIQSPADWTDPTYLALLTTGGTVGVDAYPGGYSNISITATPSSPLIITGTDANNMPIIDKLEIGNLGDVKLADMDVVSSDWDASASFSATSIDAITMGIGGGTSIISGAASLDGLRIRGNYRGDIDAYLTYDYGTHDIPEYACINGTVVGGVFTAVGLALNDTSSYIGDLLADGTGYPISVKNHTAGSGFDATFDVVSGRITNIILNNGGSGYTWPPGASSPYGILTFTNQRPMARWLPRGIGGKMSIPVGGQFTMQNCDFRHVSSAFKPAFSAGTSTDWIKTSNNTFDGVYIDLIAMTIRTKPAYCWHEWNRFTNIFGCVGDADDPHGDGQQGIMFPSTGNWVPEIWVIGHEGIIPPGARGNGGQFIFMTDANGHAYQLNCVGNAGMFQAPNGLIADVASNCFVYGNTIMPTVPDRPGHDQAVRILLSNVSTTQAYGQSLMEANIAEGFGTGAVASSKVTIRNNYSTGFVNSATPDYSAVFPDNTPPNTIAELRVKRKAIGSHAGKGAYRDSAWIDHAAMTYDNSLEPSFVRFPTVINQTASSTATSAWCKLIGGPDSQSVSVSGGTYDTATDVDLAGVVTGLSTGHTSGTLARGTWVRMNVATAATGSTATTATITIRGTYTFDFNAITATASSYTIADNQNAAYSRVTSLPTFTGGVGFIWAMRFRVDAYATSDYLFANQTGTQLNLQYQTNQWRLTMKNGSTVGSRFVMSQQAGTMVTLIAAFDLTQTDKELACRMFSNGVELSHASSNSAYGGPTTLANTDIWNTQSLNILSNNTGTLDGAIEWLWFDIYTSIGSMPDVSDPAVLAEFSTDKFAADFSTSILPQPKLAYGGASSLASWDGTFTNAGSHAGANLVKQAGTYV